MQVSCWTSSSLSKRVPQAYAIINLKKIGFSTQTHSLCTIMINFSVYFVHVRHHNKKKTSNRSATTILLGVSLYISFKCTNYCCFSKRIFKYDILIDIPYHLMTSWQFWRKTEQTGLCEMLKLILIDTYWLIFLTIPAHMSYLFLPFNFKNNIT